VTVGALSFLGTGVSVIPNVTIGKNVIIGAGTTIYRDVPDNRKLVGSPVRDLGEA
jgi:acetyltransferase-like isoleucine patch superfamily enzyme